MSREPKVGKGWQRAVALLSGLVLALGLAVGVLLARQAPSDPDKLLALALESDEVRNAAIAALVDRSEGLWDTHTDGDVGRVLQRDLEGRDFRDIPISSNAFGMREQPYLSEKRPGTTRVVLLGDSFVFGYKVRAEERLGVHLARDLVAQGGLPEGSVEVLHLAISSWNVRAECAFLRRQLHLLQPDLVAHVIVVNDLDDLRGVRGFGEMGFFNPQRRDRADGLVSQLSYPGLYPRRVTTFLLHGLDHESRERYAEARAEISGLAAAVEASGGRYLLVGAWEAYNAMVERYVVPDLAAEQLAWVPSTFSQDPAYRNDDTDRHWNPAGHRRMAQLLYGLIARRNLLGEGRVRPWPEAEAAAVELHDLGALEAANFANYEEALRSNAQEQVRSSIDFTQVDRQAAKQVHGGVDGDGSVAPYASMILARGGDTLVLEGAYLPSLGLRGGVARVFLDEFEVGVLPLDAGGELQRSFAVPQEARSRPFLGLRLVSSDYLHTDLERGTCRALRLRRVSLR